MKQLLVLIMLLLSVTLFAQKAAPEVEKTDEEYAAEYKAAEKMQRLKNEDRYTRLKALSSVKRFSKERNQLMWDDLITKYPSTLDIAMKYRLRIDQTEGKINGFGGIMHGGKLHTSVYGNYVPGDVAYDTCRAYPALDGHTKPIKESPLQTMWDEIIDKCPECIEIARKLKLDIYQLDLEEGEDYTTYIKGKTRKWPWEK